MVCQAVILQERKRNSTLLSVIQEDQLDDGWSPVISDYDQVANLKALREALVILHWTAKSADTLLMQQRMCIKG